MIHRGKLAARFRLGIVQGALLLLSALSSFASDPKLLLVVVEFNPSNPWLGSDSPKLVLYEDGTLICKPQKPTPGEPFRVRRVSDVAKFGNELVPPNFRKFSSAFDLCLSFGQEKITLI